MKGTNDMATMKEISLILILLFLSAFAGWFSPVSPTFTVGGFVQTHTILGLYGIALGVYMYHKKEE